MKKNTIKSATSKINWDIVDAIPEENYEISDNSRNFEDLDDIIEEKTKIEKIKELMIGSYEGIKNRIEHTIQWTKDTVIKYVGKIKDVFR